MKNPEPTAKYEVGQEVSYNRINTSENYRDGKKTLKGKITNLYFNVDWYYYIEGGDLWYKEDEIIV